MLAPCSANTVSMEAFASASLWVCATEAGEGSAEFAVHQGVVRQLMLLQLQQPSSWGCGPTDSLLSQPWVFACSWSAAGVCLQLECCGCFLASSRCVWHQVALAEATPAACSTAVLVLCVPTSRPHQRLSDKCGVLPGCQEQ
jgi:hypothetical protein